MASSLARSIAFFFVILNISACATMPEERGWIDNRRALGSAISRPSKGDNDQRAYLNGEYLERTFESVKVLAPSVLLSPKRDGEEKFLSDLTNALVEASIAALPLTEKFAVVSVDKPGFATQTQLSIQSWVHMATDDFSLVADPLYGEKFSRLVVIFTLTDVTNGQTIAKYTANLPSQWGYQARVREEMLEKAEEAVDEFGFMLYQL